jgi:hypothetical protein
MMKMKVRSILYFLPILLITLSSCKKDEMIEGKLVGKWYVERITIYDDSFANSPDEVMKNYTSVGTFTFNANGTGVYEFNNNLVDFTYNISDNFCTFDFDENDIVDEISPIIMYYLPIHAMNVNTYEVFHRTPNTANFSYNVYGSSSMDSFRKLEFLLTKIE